MYTSNYCNFKKNSILYFHANQLLWKPFAQFLQVQYKLPEFIVLLTLRPHSYLCVFCQKHSLFTVLHKTKVSKKFLHLFQVQSLGRFVFYFFIPHVTKPVPASHIWVGMFFSHSQNIQVWIRPFVLMLSKTSLGNERQIGQNKNLYGRITLFYQYLQLRRALHAQFFSSPICFFLVPVMDKMVQVTFTKGIISITYLALFEKFPLPFRAKWEQDIGPVLDMLGRRFFGSSNFALANLVFYFSYGVQDPRIFVCYWVRTWPSLSQIW